MNVSSVELSKKLYKVSAWNPREWGYDTSYADNWLRHIANFPHDTREWKGVNIIPAYDAGYLLRKLKPLTEERGRLFVTTRDIRDWTAGFSSTYDQYHEDKGTADTPEDALAKLAIELFKQGILTK